MNKNRDRNIAILGSTGSIGTQTLEIVRANPDLHVLALAAGSNVELMERQIREFKPKVAGMWSEEAADRLRGRGRPAREGGLGHGRTFGDCGTPRDGGISDRNCGNDWYQTYHCRH